MLIKRYKRIFSGSKRILLFLGFLCLLGIFSGVMVHAGDGSGEGVYAGAFNASEAYLFFVTFISAFIQITARCPLFSLAGTLALIVGIAFYSGSRSKLMILGGAFIGGNILIYGLFVAGIFDAFYYFDQIKYMGFIAAFIVSVLGALNIREFLRKKEIPFRNYIEIVGFALLGILFGLIEIPCTSAFPIIWTGIIIEQNLRMFFSPAIFLIYIFSYILLELIALLAALIILNLFRGFFSRNLKIIKLIGGIFFVVLGFWLSLTIGRLFEVSTFFAFLVIKFAALNALVIIRKKKNNLKVKKSGSGISKVIKTKK